jgi:hypothetical protein
MRAQAMLDSAAQQPITTIVLRKFAATARKRMRIEGGGYRRDRLRALAQRVEVADHEVRIMGSKSDLLKTLAAISGVKSATGGVRSSVLDWRRERNWVRTFSAGRARSQVGRFRAIEQPTGWVRRPWRGSRRAGNVLCGARKEPTRGQIQGLQRTFPAAAVCRHIDRSG